MNGSALQYLADAHAIIQVPSDQLVAWLKEWVDDVWMDGVEVGKRMREAEQLNALVPPLSMKEAAKAMGMSVSTLTYYIAIGKVRRMDTKGDKCIPVSEVERFKKESLRFPI